MSWYFSIFGIFLFCVFVVVLAVYVYFKSAYNHWKKHGVPYLSPVFPFGNMRGYILQKINIGDQILDLYEQLKNCGEKFAGIYVFSEPNVFVLSPELSKNILSKDFQHFVDRGLNTNPKYDPLGDHMFSATGTKWKNSRTKLSPTFTSGKMKMMFPTLVAVTEKLMDVMEENVRLAKPIDIKETMARFTTDVIGSCAFGLESNSLQNDEDEFRKCGKSFMECKTLGRKIKLASTFFAPKLMELTKMKATPDEVEDFFTNVITDIVDYREKNNVKRNDFMELLLQLKNEGRLLDDENADLKEETTMTIKEIIGQCFVFFLGGFETSSSTMAFLFYELAKNQNIQEKLREELLRVLNEHNGKITYDALMEMPYLDKVVSETLRKYPILPVLNRECTNDYQVPDSSFVIKKGQKIMIPVIGIHRDPDIYPNPNLFDPERFNEDSKSSRHPYSYLPFGEGPRFCIGKRFGLMQTKLGVATVLKSYRVSLNPMTVDPVVLDPKTPLAVSPRDPILLDAIKI